LNAGEVDAMERDKVKIVTLIPGPTGVLLVVLILAGGCNTWQSRAYPGGALW
jgi:hypothetical protein